ncbi:hypothetical protein GCM10022221_25730 [Actinocorallia aurea]
MRELAIDPPQAPRPWSVAVGMLLGFLTLLVVEGRTAPFDLALHDWAMTHRPPWAESAARLLTDTAVGLPVALLALLAGAVLAGAAASARRRAVWALLALAALLAGALVRRGAGELIGRARPPQADWAVFAAGNAFPSGHTTAATVVAVLLGAAFTRPGVRVLIAAWAFGVGLTRIWLGVHWPADVLGGWCLGLLWGAAAVWFLRSGLPDRLAGRNRRDHRDRASA